ncbi:hypothetical protein [Macrococcus armenti]|uniref:Uncharacterized protein n=1 Tax=Macrococcus armenti TaxID=2875764 RepID=A0ABY3ZV63_9STAP|nr:hypothetical protein [Macrococcus armenti]UOB20781.1 hypothetical protein MRZ06_01465 [Macrococcus armenti]
MRRSQYALFHVQQQLKQLPILVDNLISAMKDKPLKAHYDGATACPVATEYGQAFIAEFGYDMKPKE